MAIIADLPNTVPTAMGFRCYHLKHHSHLGDYDYDADLPGHWEARIVGNRWYAKAIWLFGFAIVQVTRLGRLKGTVPMMGLGFFVLTVDGHKYVFHDGDQGGFTAELMIDPARQSGSIVMSNTTDTGAPVDATHAQSNTEPDPKTDLRMQLRDVLVKDVYPSVGK